MKEPHVCPWWLAYTFDNPLRRLIHRPETVLGGEVREGMTVLDIGCGMGYFSIAMARLVGPQGLVIAADLQPEMLETARKRAQKAGVADRIRTHLCAAGTLGVQDRVDFALAFWMVHEAPDALSLFRQVAALLKPGGKMLVAEPRFHVSAGHFEKILAAAGQAGLKIAARPRIFWSRAALFSSDGRDT